MEVNKSAEARVRTGMVLPPLDFESSASTSFATSAEKQGHKITFFMPEQAIHTGQAMAINGILLGVGFMMHGYRNSLLYTVIGILQLITNPMFLIPNGIVQLIGLWLSLPFINIKRFKNIVRST